MNQETLNVIMTAVVVPLAGVLVPFAVAAIRAYTAKLKAETEDKRLQRYIDIAEDAVCTAVNSVYQTYVSNIKGTSDWTQATQEVAFDEAKRKAISIMGTAAVLALQETDIDLDTWLDHKIESYVSHTP